MLHQSLGRQILETQYPTSRYIARPENWFSRMELIELWQPMLTPEALLHPFLQSQSAIRESAEQTQRLTETFGIPRLGSSRRVPQSGTSDQSGTSPIAALLTS